MKKIVHSSHFFLLHVLLAELPMKKASLTMGLMQSKKLAGKLEIKVRNNGIRIPEKMSGEIISHFLRPNKPGKGLILGLPFLITF